MHEYVDDILGSGIWTDPRDVYSLTPHEVSVISRGVNQRESDLQRAENIRIGTLCATIYNSKRTKHTQRVWKWSDFFPDKSARMPDEKRILEQAGNIVRIFGGK